MSEMTTFTSFKFFSCNIVFIFIQVNLTDGGGSVRRSQKQILRQGSG
jgi:hypothetical protein